MGRTVEANQMKKLAKYRYQKPTELKKGWIKENKEKLSKEMQETCQEYEEKLIKEIVDANQKSELLDKKNIKNYEITSSTIPSEDDLKYFEMIMAENESDPVFSEISKTESEKFPHYARIISLLDENIKKSKLTQKGCL